MIKRQSDKNLSLKNQYQS